MSVVLIFGGLALLALPGVLRNHCLRLRPRESATVILTSLVSGAVVLELALVLLALPTVLRVVRISGLADVCERALAAHTSGGVVLGWAALLAAAVIATAAVRAADKARRAIRAARVELWLGEHIDRDGYELVVLPTGVVAAFGVPGERPQVVVSHGTLDALTLEEQDVVIRHEVAHLHHHHWRYLFVATTLEQSLAPLRFVRTSTRALRASLERWADTEATHETPEQRAVLCGALAGIASQLGASSAPRRSAGATVVERAEELLLARGRRAPIARPLAYLPVGMTIVVSMMLFSALLHTSHHLAALGGYCPS